MDPAFIRGTEQGGSALLPENDQLIEPYDQDEPDTDLTGNGLLNASERDILVYPNPGKGLFTLDFSMNISGNAIIKVFDDRMNMIIDKEIQVIEGSNSEILDLSGRAVGTYIVLLITKEGTFTASVIKTAD
jgi:hypothetical protein